MKSAAEQLDELRAFRERRRPGHAVRADRALGDAATPGSASTATRWPGDPAFRDGLRARDLGDPAPERWEAAYRDGIDALVIVGSHDDALTDARVARGARPARQLGARARRRDRDARSRTRDGDAIEHFGYVDGRSQPLFIDEDLEHERETTDGVDRWNPLVPLSHVLVPDPAATDGDHAYGSYLVYRKLEQNVRAFKQQEARDRARARPDRRERRARRARC